MPTATVPQIGAVTTVPTIVTINESFVLQAVVTEVSATLEYNWPFSGTMHSGQEEIWPWQ